MGPDPWRGAWSGFLVNSPGHPAWGAPLCAPPGGSPLLPAWGLPSAPSLGGSPLLPAWGAPLCAQPGGSSGHRHGKGLSDVGATMNPVPEDISSSDSGPCGVWSLGGLPHSPGASAHTTQGCPARRWERGPGAQCPPSRLSTRRHLPCPCDPGKTRPWMRVKGGAAPAVLIPRNPQAPGAPGEGVSRTWWPLPQECHPVGGPLPSPSGGGDSPL